MKILVSFIFVIWIPTFLNAASFNCAKASSKNEKAICSDPELSNLDEILADIYRETRRSVSDAKRLKGEQINWIKSVATCDGNVDCLISAYENRILVLDYWDGQLSLIVDPLQNRIAQLDEREEILALRENAFTTELRALDAQLVEREEILALRESAFTTELRALEEEMERFDKEKLAFNLSKDVPAKVQKPNTQAPEVAIEVPKVQKTKMILPQYQSDYFIYEPCDQPPTSLVENQLEGAFSIMIDAISAYNSQPNVDMIMEYPIKAACLTSVGKPGTILEGLMTVNFYVNYDHFVCSVVNENCQGQRMGYQAAINFKGNDLQVTANTYRFEDAVMHCHRNGVRYEGGC